jgi:hypothetical protein
VRHTARVLRALHRTTPHAWCSLIACLAGAALLLAGCGGSPIPAHKHRKPRVDKVTLVSASVIAKSAKLSAKQAGYAVSLNLSLEVQQLGGITAATAKGTFDDDGGQLSATLNLPGLLALISPLTTPVIVSGGIAYVKVPAVAAEELTGVKPWLSVSLSGAGQLLGLSANALAGALTPRTILEALATGSTGKAILVGPKLIRGRKTTEYREVIPEFGAKHPIGVWIDSQTGLLTQVAFIATHYGSDGAQIDFTAYGPQAAAVPPPPSEVGSLAVALNSAGI